MPEAVNFLLIGFGDLGRKRIFPELIRLMSQGEERINIFPCDKDRRYASLTKAELFKACSLEPQYRTESVYEQFRRNFHCVEDNVNNLWERINRQVATIAYVAVDNPGAYKEIIDRYSAYCRLFAIEKPFALSSSEALDLQRHVNSYGDAISFVPVDHYRHKWAIRSLKNLLANSTTRRFIELADAIEISVLERREIEKERKNLLGRIGVVFDLAPHIFAVIREITNSYDEIQIEDVFVATYMEDKGDGTREYPISHKGLPMETYAEMIINIFKNTAKEKRVYVRFGKATGTEEGKIVFHSGGDTLELNLKRGREVCLNLKRFDALRLTPLAAVRDTSYLEILRELVNFSPGDFMTVNDAVDVTFKLEEAKAKIRNPDEMSEYRPGEVPDLLYEYEGVRWTDLGRFIYTSVYVPRKILIFDLFGVIVDYADIHRRVFSQVYSELNISNPSYLTEEFLRQNPQKILQTVIEEQGVNENVDEWINRAFAMIRTYLEDEGVPPEGVQVPGAKAFIQYLRARNVSVALVSAAPRYLIDSVLQKIGLTKAFHAIFSGKEEFRPKNDPAFYRSVLEGLHADPEDCIVLDDLEDGIGAAKAVGMKTVAFRLGSRAQLAEPADYRASTFKEVQAIVDSELGASAEGSSEPTVRDHLVGG